MAYSYPINNFNGTLKTTVNEGTVDTSTDIRFVGKNYAGYGEIQNENFLHLLQNFANTTAPPKRIDGQVWYDSGEKKLKFYTGNRWKVAGGCEVGNIPPSGLAPGDFWFDTTTNQLKTWNGSDFTLIGPPTAPAFGASTFQAAVVKEKDTNTNYAILKILVADTVVAIISKQAFILDPAEGIAGFTTLKKGITLPDTNATTGESSNDWRFWGTTSNSLRLGGVLATEYIQKTNATFNQEVSFQDVGYKVGQDSELRVYIQGGDLVVFENQKGRTLQSPGSMIHRIVDGGVDRDVLIVSASGLAPGAGLTYDIGSVSNRYRDIYLRNIFASAIGSVSLPVTVTGNTTGTHKGNVTANDDTVAFNAATKSFTGSFFGTVGDPNNPATIFGSVTGSANNADKLNNKTESATVPVTVDKTSIVSRNAAGNIAANQFIGIVDKADQLKVGSLYYSTSITVPVSVDKTSVVARSSDGNIDAELFQGTATSARYADLAEKYLADQEYEVGTVVIVGGDKEVTASSWGQRAIGVVSANPAFKMNSELEGGTYIALKGRVPVKVIGRVKKGDRLISSNNGCASAGVPHSNDVFAIALESNDSEDIKLVESVIL